jgi:hypothetical protein
MHNICSFLGQWLIFKAIAVPNIKESTESIVWPDVKPEFRHLVLASLPQNKAVHQKRALRVGRLLREMLGGTCI